MKRAHLRAVFFLTLFLCAKGLEYHPLGHVDEGTSDRCELCDFAVLLHDTPFDTPELPVFEGPFLPASDSIAQSTCTFPIISQELGAGQFYRPPPQASLSI